MVGLAHREASTMAALAVGPKTAQTYRETGSIRETAQSWHTTREVVRRWVRRYQAEGEAGLSACNAQTGKIPDAETLLEMAARWVFYYTVSRPHSPSQNGRWSQRWCRRSESNRHGSETSTRF
jgi:hypothetical protein